MNRTLLLLSIGFLVTSLSAQQVVTLDLCYEQAIEHYPLSAQRTLHQASNELKISSLNKNYLPELLINGQMHYQSDVTKTPAMNIPAFEFETLEKDWYKIMLDVNQVIYDGSATSRQKELEQVNLEINNQNLVIELFQLKQRINQVYFSIILSKENEKILVLHKETLESNLKKVRCGIENGSILASNEDILKAEIIQIEQSIEELIIARNAAINILREYTQLELDGSTEFQLPEIQVNPGTFTNNRPEYALFSMEQRKIEASKKLVGSKTLPRLMAFGQAGYGRPGYDMLKNDFDDFYMIGARLSWNFWDWNQTRKEQEILSVQRDIVHTRMETFDKHIRIDLENKLAGIRKTENRIIRDKELIDLRERISEASASQLEHGIITSTEYITELNAESTARLNLEVHKIELIQAKLEYQTTLGNI